LVEEKEPWCNDVSSIADIAILSAFAVNKKESESASLSDTGAGRILSEKHYLYDIIDSECDFSKYKVIILPDCVESNENVDKKLAEYISNGGKILASGLSGKGILPGIEIGEQRELKPNYMHPVSENGFVNGITEYVMYTDSYRFEPSPEYKTVAYTVDTYFNRTSEHFCSHQHTPNRPGFLTKGSVISDNIGYIDHKIFEDYAVKGELHCKELCDMMLSSLLGEDRTASVEGLPDRGVFTLLYQKENNRLISHILYAHTSIRGKNVEAIEDCVPLYNVSVKIRTEKAVKNVRLVPEGQSLPFEYKDGLLTYTVPKTLIHSMVEISF
ncbi:MAG: beta-galactosidase trimerization domain-containing protein, partial [Clostridiales bacterium]|nr:beta-galactosidase trimerization domain-containing protein [Clostridiales bacterium]